MVKNHILTLPDEVMELVFLYFSVSDLLTSTLVCKRWNSIISREGSETVTKLIPRVPCPYPFHYENPILNFNLTRKYSGLKFDFMTTCKRHSSYENMCQIICTSLHESLTRLELYQVNFGVGFMESLEKCQKIRFLSFIYCIFESSNTDQIQKTVNFHSLQCLKLFKSSETILETMECDKLRQLTIHERACDYECNRRINLYSSCTVKFLNKLKTLDELYVKFASDEFKDKLEPKFRLKCLNLSFILSSWFDDEYKSEHFRYYKIVIENMIALNDSLKEDANVTISSTMYGRKLLNCFVKIDSLRLYKYWRDVLGVRELHEVRKLTLDMFDGDQVINLMLKLPNVEDLTLVHDGVLKPLDNEPDLGAMLFKNVQKLRIDRITKLSFADHDFIICRIKRIKFPKLEVLFIKHELDDGADIFHDHLKELKSFCRHNETLKNLVIKVIKYYEDFFSGTCLHKLQFNELKNELSGTSVRKCQIIYEFHHENKTNLFSMHETKTEVCSFRTRDEKDLKMFGRILNDDEKTFFSEIILCEKHYS